MVQCAQSFPSQFSAPSRAPRFEIHADRCPQVLPRILGLFARLDLLPVDLRARQSCGGLWIRLAVEIDAASAERAAEKLRAIVGVEAVVLIHVAAERRGEPRPIARLVTARRSEAQELRAVAAA